MFVLLNDLTADKPIIVYTMPILEKSSKEDKIGTISILERRLHREKTHTHIQMGVQSTEVGVASLCPSTHHVLYHLHIVTVQDSRWPTLYMAFWHTLAVYLGHCISSTTALILFYTKVHQF